MCYSCWIWCYFSRSWIAQRKPPWNRNHMGTFLHQNLIFPAERGRKRKNGLTDYRRWRQWMHRDPVSWFINSVWICNSRLARDDWFIGAVCRWWWRQCWKDNVAPARHDHELNVGGRHSNNGYSVSLKSKRHIYLAGSQSKWLCYLYIYHDVLGTSESVLLQTWASIQEHCHKSIITDPILFTFYHLDDNSWSPIPNNVGFIWILSKKFLFLHLKWD